MADMTVAEVLTAYTDNLNRGTAKREVYLRQGAGKQDELRTLLDLAEQLKWVLVPIKPSPVFVANLARQLGAASAGRVTHAFRDHWREIVFGAAAVGSALSVIGLVAYLVRNRGQAKAPIASTG